MLPSLFALFFLHLTIFPQQEKRTRDLLSAAVGATHQRKGCKYAATILPCQAFASGRLFPGAGKGEEGKKTQKDTVHCWALNYWSAPGRKKSGIRQPGWGSTQGSHPILSTWQRKIKLHFLFHLALDNIHGGIRCTFTCLNAKDIKVQSGAGFKEKKPQKD